MGNWKNISAIIPNRLYLGNLISARSTRSLTEHRITHVLSVCTDPIPAELPESGIRHKRIAIEDVDYEDLLIHLPCAVNFIQTSLQDGGVILVHCDHGVSRSAVVIAAYLMFTEHISSVKALEMVRRVREQIWVNAGFQEQLVLYELCRYAPSPSEGIYVKWRTVLDRRLASMGLTR
ncbi:hypothetical protein D9758_015705 [Tetrapyrgos nigripes]|uniref:protein-tyrosine-phosphatase n=1 Tax=Tetrapyrgos nigripes TaxID=182062 RepID=A0A8H5FIA3_9AGAR|nr:hypothetical protein D9758_015705 [Tetrapyrgos nigripes]